MNSMKLVALTGLSALFLITTGCSSSNQVAEQSGMKSGGDGKGSSPSGAAAKEADQAIVRFINATTKSKDLAFGDVVQFKDVGDRYVSAFKEVPAERQDFKLMAHDGGAVLATNSEGLGAGKRYTVLAVTEKNGKEKLDVVNDDPTPPTAGRAKVRVINLAPSMQKVDLYAGNDKDAVVSGAGLDSPTDYKEVDPAVAELAVRHGANKRHSAVIKDINLKPGKLYTILVFEDKNHSLKTKTIEDEFTAAPRGVAKAS